MSTESARTQKILDLLEDFSFASLKELFWTELGYPRVAEALSWREWPDPVRRLLAEAPLLLAAAGAGGGFHVLYCRMAAGRLSLAEERQLVTLLLREHPYALFVFSNRAQDEWHFVNVKIAFTNQGEENRDPARRRLFRRIAVVRGELNRTGAERLVELDTAKLPGGDGASPLAIQEVHDHAFDVDKVSREFYQTYRAVFEDVERLIQGFGDDHARRRLFTQRLFNRLMLVVFVQKKGWLEFEGIRKNYLNALWDAYRSRPEEPREQDNFYRDRLLRLFQDVLNRAREMLSVAASGFIQRLVGTGPYLNGGLFEENALDRTPGLDVPDDAIYFILQHLFEKYNFTITEATPLEVEVAVDPEMLGKVFEELITYRRETGSYFTPKTVVSFMCREALKGYLRGAVPRESATAIARFVDRHAAVGLRDGEAVLQALREVRVCDPACGSGAYLLGMLHELLDLRAALFTTGSPDTAFVYERKLEIIQNNLYGVDVDPFAVDIARFRLWLSLIVDFTGGADDVPPLPNLDFKIERGDSLTVPRPEHLGLAAEVVYRVQRLKGDYLTAHGLEKERVLAEIAAATETLSAMSPVRATGDDFNWWVRFAEVFTEGAASVTLAGQHNGAAVPTAPRPGGFDIVLANPPYGAEVADSVRNLYFNRVTDGPQSKDTYGLFIARGLELLRPGGYLSYIVSDTWRTIRTHRPLRRRLVDRTRVHHLLDLPSWIFGATVNTCILNLRAEGCEPSHRLTSGDLRALPRGVWEYLAASLTELSAAAPDVQTTVLARYTYPQRSIPLYENLSFFVGSPTLFEKSLGRGLPRLGDLAEVRVGLQTGDNPAYVRKAPGVHGGYDLVDPDLVLGRDEVALLGADEIRDGIDPGRHGGRSFVPYDKDGESAAGEGWLPNYHVPTGYFIDWSRDAVRRLRTLTVADVKRRKGDRKIAPDDETRIASRFQNAEFYFREGITFSDSGIYAPTFRRSAGSVFDQKGSVIIPREGMDRDFLLGILCSRWIRYVLKTYVNHTVSAHVDSIKELPVIATGSEVPRIAELVRRIIAKQEREPRYPYHLHEQREIDALVFSLYGLTEDEIREVDLWFRRRYPALADVSIGARREAAA